jgi:hypothetical protein
MIRNSVGMYFQERDRGTKSVACKEEGGGKWPKEDEVHFISKAVMLG